jgi:predicted AAA+ superfamily ATPase
LTGRYLLTELFPFSYNEYLTLKKLKRSEKSVLSYMSEGGFPEYLKDPDNEYLHRIYYDIIYRDIAVRHKIRHVENLKTLALFLITNANKKISYNRIRNTFSMGSTNTVIDYISYFADSYLFFIVPKFDFSVRKQISNERKIYSIDTGLSTINSASFSEDTGRKLENIVYLFLRNQHRDIYYFSAKHECDFVIRTKADKYLLVQVCLELSPDNIDRELNGLMEAMNYLGCREGIIITLTQKDTLEKNGTMIPVIPFHELSQFEVKN